MKILFLNAYFEPETIAFSHLEKDLLEALADSGHTIDILTPVPTRGVTDFQRTQYRNIRSEMKYGGAVHVHRFMMFREGKTPFFRALRYVLTSGIQLIQGSRVKGIDIVFAVSTPPTQGALCAYVKKKLKVPFVYSLQDIFPDSLVNAEITEKGSLLWKIGRQIEAYTYRNADRIVVISDDFKKNLMAKGVSSEKIEVIHNWIDEQSIIPVSRSSNMLFDELGLPRDKFYVSYAGTIGESQGIDVILQAAKELRINTDIVFVLFGSGSRFRYYGDRIMEQGLSNLRLYPLQPYSRVSEVYSMSNISLVSCKKGAGLAAFPSKTWSIMSAGIPVLASFDRGTELERILEAFNCGRLVEAGDALKLSEQITWFFEHPEQCAIMGDNARNCVVNSFSKSKSVEKYVNLFETIGIGYSEGEEETI